MTPERRRVDAAGPRARRAAPRRAASAPRVLIVGAGVMGCATARELSGRGALVTVLERAVPGAEASSAAGGILGAQVEAHADGPAFRLGLESRALHARWARELLAETGLSVEHRVGGVLRVDTAPGAARRLERAARWQRAVDQDVRALGPRELRALEPALSPAVGGGVWFVGDAQLDPPALLTALRVSAQRRGARFVSGSTVRRVALDGQGRATGVTLSTGERHDADHVVIAAGSWTSLVDGLPAEAAAVVPARGQMVELRTAAPLLGRVVFGPGCYLVPRVDGRVLVGSTMELVGFDRDVTAGAVQELLAAALALVPGLAGAALSRTWANFRPYATGGAPFIGPTAVPGLHLATGHHRNGILLAPATAQRVAAGIPGLAPRRSPR